MKNRRIDKLKDTFTEQTLLTTALDTLRAEKHPGQSLRCPSKLTQKQTKLADEAAQAFPDNFEIRLRLAIYYARSYKSATGINNDRKALSLYAQAYALAPDNIRLNMEYGRLLIKNQNFVAAENCFIRCLQLEGLKSHPLTRLGYTYEKWASHITDTESKRTLEKLSLLCFKKSYQINSTHKLAEPDLRRSENTLGETRDLEIDWAEYEEYTKEHAELPPIDVQPN